MMKKVFILLSILFFSRISTKAQANLQYNKVKLVTVSGTYYGYPIDTLFTVPVGKVWKIESAIAGTVSYPGMSFGLFLDGKPIYNTGGTNVFPFWLPSGSYTLTTTCLNNSNYIPIKGAISVIEYNEVP